MNGSTIFFLSWCILMLIMFYLFYTRGKKAIAIFPDIQTVVVKFRDRTASGYSTKSLMTKLGGSGRGLDIIVTENELWLKCPLLFASILEQHDLLHRVPLINIINVEHISDKVSIEFTSQSGIPTKVVLTIKKPAELLAALAKNYA